MVNLFAFDIHVKSWSTKEAVKLSVDEQPFAEGGFRKAFRAVASSGKIIGQWVIKKCKAEHWSALSSLGRHLSYKQSGVFR